MPYSTIAILGKRASGKISADDYIDWAGEILLQGSDTKTLSILAGARHLIGLYEAEKYFLQCLKELNIAFPTTRQALGNYACEIAQQIVDDKIPAQQGIRIMSEFWADSEYDRDYSIWLELDDALDIFLAGEFPYSFESLTLENLEQVVKNEAIKFIKSMKGQNTT